MKRILILSIMMAFLACSCRSGKDINIHVNHAKEKDTYKTPAEKKYKTKKKF